MKGNLAGNHKSKERLYDTGLLYSHRLKSRVFNSVKSDHALYFDTRLMSKPKSSTQFALRLFFNDHDFVSAISHRSHACFTPRRSHPTRFIRCVISSTSACVCVPVGGKNPRMSKHEYDRYKTLKYQIIFFPSNS